MKGKLATSAIAGYNKRGQIWINRKVPKYYKGINVKARLLKHEKVERELRKKGIPYKHAHKVALREEHKGLTRRQIAKYEGLLGAIARHYPKRR